MSDKIVETIYGKYAKFEVFKKSTTFTTSFVVRKDGAYESSHSTLDKAVDHARQVGGVK